MGRNYWRLFLALFVAALFVYFPVINGEFLNWDDEEYVVNNPYIKSFPALPAVFSSYFMGNYHPLALISLFIDYQLVGLSPWFFHVHNLLLHVFNSFLVFLILKSLTKNEYFAGFGSLIFCIHPQHVESVAWISERKDVLYALFFLSSVLSYLKYIENTSLNIKWYFTALLLFLLSLLSKGQAVILSAVLVWVDLYCGREKTRRFYVDKIPFFALSLLFGLIAIKAQKEASAVVSSIHLFSPFERFVIISKGFSIYIEKFLFPFSFSAIYPYPKAKEPIPAGFYVGIIFLLSFLFLLFYSFKKNKSSFYGLLLFLICIFPLLQFIPVGEAIASDRYMYIPMIGLILAIYPLFVHLLSLKFSKYTSGLIIIILCIPSFIRANVWSDKKLFWSTQMEQTPAYGKPFNNYGAILCTENDTASAIPYFKKAAELGYHLAYQSLGVVEKNKKNYAAADSLFSLAIKGSNSNTNCYYSRSIARLYLKKYDLALADIDIAISLDQKNGKYYSTRGDLYFLKKDFPSAIQNYNLSESFDPVKNPDFYYNRGKAKIENNDYPSAIEDLSIYLTQKKSSEAFYKRALLYKQLNKTDLYLNDLKESLSIDSNYVVSLKERAVFFFLSSNYNACLKDFSALIRKNPSDFTLINNRGLAKQNLKNYEGAIADYSLATKVNPLFIDAYYNRGRTYTLLNKYELAINDYNACITLNPQHSAAFKFRGLCYLGLGKKTKACFDYSQAVKYKFSGDLSMLEAACK